MDSTTMLEHISDELRNVNIDSKINRWINLATVDIATDFIFGHLHSHGSVTTSTSPDVTMPSDFLWLKTLEIPAQVRKIWPIDEQRLSEAYPDYRSQQGTISRYYLDGRTLGLWMVPSNGIVLTFAYQRRPVDFTELPEEWHLLIAQKAITMGNRYDGNSQGVIDSERAEAKQLLKLGAHVHKRPDDTLIMGENATASRGSKPAYPTMPAHYPRFRRF